MSFFSKISAGVRALGNRERINRDLADEVQHFLESAIAANRAKGMSQADAERDARIQLGSVSSAQAPARAWGWDVGLETLMQDVRYAVRHLAKAPGFTAAAALSLALGIGANTAIFSMVNATLIKRLPFARPEEVVSVLPPGNSGTFSYPAFDELRRANTSFTGMAAFGGTTIALTDGENTAVISGAIVTGSYFDVLGIAPVRGRLLSPNDDVTPGAHPVAVISEGLWKSRFNSRADIVGHTIVLNSQAFTVIGVTPADFRGTQPGVVRDIYVPMMMQAWMRPPRSGYSGEMNPDLLTVRGNSWLFSIARLKPGVTTTQAADAVTATARAIGDWTQAQEPLPKASVVPITDGPPGQRAQLLSVAQLLAAVVLAVLIISCANVANLLLARATARRKEIAVRLAIGATRTRLVRQLLTESLLLSALGGVLGLGLAWVAIRGVIATPPPSGSLPVTLDFALDLRVLAFTLGLSMLTGVIFGLVPAMHASKPELVPALKDQASSAQPRRRFNARSVLVVAQVALSFVLLISAGLFVRSLQRLRSVSPDFDVDRIVSAPLNVQLLRYTRDQGTAFYRDIVDKISALPGVESAALVRWVPIAGGNSASSLHIEGQAARTTEAFGSEGSGFDTSNPETVNSNLVSVGYFKTMGIQLKQGRDFTAYDGAEATRVVVVNETFAKRHFGNENPIGRRISLNGLNPPVWQEIVGIVADSKYARIDEPPTRMVYRPLAQNHVNGVSLVVRASGDPSNLTGVIAREIRSLDRSLPVSGVQTMNDVLGTSIYAARAGAMLLTGFGALALLLAAIGLYGVLAYAVSRRTREFGLRMALGAQAHDVLSQVLREGIGLVILGVVGGFAVAFVVTPLLGKFLYSTSTTDIGAFIGAPLVLLFVATMACLIPARRATLVDPIRALKQD